MRKQLYERSRAEAARVLAAHYGHKGRAGGWVYRSATAARPICQGYERYADLSGCIVPKRVGGQVRWAIDWSRSRWDRSRRAEPLTLAQQRERYQAVVLRGQGG